MGDFSFDPAQVTAHVTGLLDKGGVTIWLIAGLSVLTLALILWKAWRLALMGAWSKSKAELAVNTWTGGDHVGAAALVRGRRGARAMLVATAMSANHEMNAADAREDTSRVARNLLGEAGRGLRALELIATIAPLLGLLGTVLGMITAFQTLQDAGSRADPSALAGGIWEALLTTAAGMAVAIPASAALTWFESVIDRMRLDMEDAATRVFTRSKPNALKVAAE